jgi:F0F1-type ATP synthase membrane subunit b/b'
MSTLTPDFTFYISIVHVSILFIFLYRKFGKGIDGFLAGRRSSISETLLASKRFQEEIQEKKLDLDRRFSTLDADRAKIFAEWSKRLQDDLAQAKLESEHLARMIRDEHTQNLRALTIAVEGELRRDIAEKVLVLAEQRILRSMNDGTRATIQKRVIQEMAGVSL